MRRPSPARLLCVALVVLLPACGTPETRTERIADEIGGLPFDSLGDWRSYADLVAVVEISDETTTLAASPQLGADASYQRAVTASVDRVIWSRSSAPPPNEVAFETWGSERRGGDWIDLAPERGPRIELGARYLIAFVLEAEPRPQSPSSVLEIDERGRVRAAAHTTGGSAAIDGLTIDEVERALSAARPDPLAVRYEHIPPSDRYGLVMAAREPD